MNLKKQGMLFLPSVFDTPHKISKTGVYTFVYHPNNMTDSDFEYLESFIIKHRDCFDVNMTDVIEKYSNRTRTIKDFLLGIAIVAYRKIRKVRKRKNRGGKFE